MGVPFGPAGESGLTQRTQYGTFSSEVTEMTTLTASQARAQLYKLLDMAASSHEPIQITGKRANAVLVSEEDWRAVQETLYLLSIPGMRESILKGMKEPVEKCGVKLKW
jgi:antitoxin YefM